VATYYTMFSLKPGDRYIIRVCNSPVCDMERSPDIVREIEKLLLIDIGETTSDNRFTLELSECLGQCDSAPGMMINENIHGNLNRDKLRSIIENYDTK